MNRKVKAMLVEQGVSQKEIAEELGVERSTVSGVINGHHSSLRIMTHIAKRLGKPYEKVWGRPSRRPRTDAAV